MRASNRIIPSFRVPLGLNVETLLVEVVEHGVVLNFHRVV